MDRDLAILGAFVAAVGGFWLVLSCWNPGWLMREHRWRSSVKAIGVKATRWVYATLACVVILIGGALIVAATVGRPR